MVARRQILLLSKCAGQREQYLGGEHGIELVEKNGA
jgi:hypothetical protein